MISRRWSRPAQQAAGNATAAHGRRRRLRAAAAALVLLAGMHTAVAVGAAEPRSVPAGPVAPPQWPNSFLAAPRLEGWPNGLRIFGADQFQTSLAAALTLRGGGSFPFDSPEAPNGIDTSLSAASGWWGLDTCPRTVIVAAGDSPADALAAAALSDSTGESAEPYLRRSAAADPLFDPPGGFARVDTFAAPILLTPSARAEATALAVPVRLAAQDLRSGGCKTARQAIIVGGPAAVAPEIEAELVSIGYTEVFRVGGENRYGTAAAVAAALGTAAVPSDADGCADDAADDGTPVMGFWANSVVEWRNSAEECRLLGRTVALADGVAGADALAAGWWTSYWQVPVLLHDGSDELPAETARALSLLEVDNIIVLGGLARLSQPVVQSAARLARAETFRVAGRDRYETSLRMAEHLGGWWPSGSGHDFAGSMVCVTSSSGEGRDPRGWADAVVAGPWCGAASGATTRGAPQRMLPPVNLSQPAVVAEAGEELRRRPTRQAVPLLLVPTAAERLPDSVAAFLLDAFAAPERCAANGDPAGYAAALANETCPLPGFVVAFGTEANLSADVLGELSAAVSGDMSLPRDAAPLLVGAQTPDELSPYGVQAAPGVPFGAGAFATTLPMAPVFHVTGPPGVQMCLPRGTYAHTRWLRAESRSGAETVDVPAQRWYLVDADGKARSAGRGSPACVYLGTAGSRTRSLLARGVGPSGATTDTVMLAADSNRRFALSGSIRAANPSVIGIATEDDPPEGGHTRWLFQTGAHSATVTLGTDSQAVADSRLVIRLDRGTANSSAGEGAASADTFTAEWTISTASGTVSGTAQGEALLRNKVWQLRGVTVLRSGTWAHGQFGSAPPPLSDEGPTPTRPVWAPFAPLRAGTSGAYGAGGFWANVEVNAPGAADDTIRWQADAYVNVSVPE